jgi:GNAT superfamily N-acetyltransferase
MKKTQAIRKCTSEDFDAMYEIINDSACVYKGKIPADCWHEPYMSVEDLWQQICAGVKFWGYAEKGRLLGVMGIQELEDVTLIRHAYVRTASQGKGIGSKLLVFLLSKAKNPVLVGTWKAARWAIRFYEKHGFKCVAEKEKNRLLRTYWPISQRQIDTSVVLRQ